MNIKKMRSKVNRAIRRGLLFAGIAIVATLISVELCVLWVYAVDFISYIFQSIGLSESLSITIGVLTTIAGAVGAVSTLEVGEQ